jgi:hypothetical protein
MTGFTAIPGTGVASAEWLHWLFVQGHRAISCSLEVRGDGRYVASLVPLWSPDDDITEVFRRPDDAIQWQERMGDQLQRAGWLLVERRVVTNAA